MNARELNPGWVAGAALTVLSSAAVAAVTLTSAAAPLAAAQPEPVAGVVAAAYQSAPSPVTLTFPAPPPPPPPAQAAPPAPRPAAPKAAPTRAPRPAATAPAPDARCEGAGWEARRGEAAISRLRRPADGRAITLTFQPGRPDVLGLADLGARRVDVFVRSCAKESDGLLLHVLAHELGHIVDGSRMNDSLRGQWLAARGIPADTPWFGCSGCSDFATPAGDFAETYAQWQRGASSNRSQLAPAPSRAQLAELAQRFFAPL